MRWCWWSLRTWRWGGSGCWSPPSTETTGRWSPTNRSGWFSSTPTAPPGKRSRPRFIWAVPEVRGLWAAEADFDRPGVWSAAVRTPDGRLIRGAPFSVAAAPLTAAVGGQAPPSRSKTLADGPLESITSDPDPDPRLYEMTVADAVESGRPSVIVFSTPAFCVSRTCGPTLEAAKSLIGRRPEVNWVHVEVYGLFGNVGGGAG